MFIGLEHEEGEHLNKITAKMICLSSSVFHILYKKRVNTEESEKIYI